MSPDMIQQFAHYVAKRIQDQAGLKKVEVRVRIVNTLNSRNAQLMIDPKVDLASLPRSYFHKKWILPLTQPPRELWSGKKTTEIVDEERRKALRKA